MSDNVVEAFAGNCAVVEGGVHPRIDHNHHKVVAAEGAVVN